MLYYIASLVMAHAENQHKGLAFCLLTIEGKNMVDSTPECSARELRDLELLVFIAEHQHLLDERLIDEIKGITPPVPTDTNNSSMFKTNLYLKLSQTLVRFQDVEQNNDRNYTDVILAILGKAREHLIDYRTVEPTMNPAVWDSIEMAIAVVESRTYDFKNKLGEDVAIASIEVFDRALHILGRENLIGRELVSVLYSHILVSKAFAQQQLAWFDLAIENYSVALLTFTRHQYPQEWADTKFSLGECCQASDRVEAAIEHYQFTLSVQSQANNPKSQRKLALTYLCLAECYDSVGDRTSDALARQKATYYRHLADR